jgi:hypothetical protein
MSLSSLTDKSVVAMAMGSVAPFRSLVEIGTAFSGTATTVMDIGKIRRRCYYIRVRKNGLE